MFITFEGIEGSGKSLQISRSQAYLQQRGVSCLVTREPGGTDFGVALRQVLLRTDGPQREPICELLLYLADRCQHLQEVIEPQLKRGGVVLSDRYHDATRAYQCVAQGIPESVVDSLARLLNIREPDRTILLDLEPEEGLARARMRNNMYPPARTEGRYEAENLLFHRKVRDAYLELARRSPQRICVVQASGTPEEVFNRILPLLERWLAFPR